MQMRDESLNCCSRFTIKQVDMEKEVQPDTDDDAVEDHFDYHRTVYVTAKSL